MQCSAVQCSAAWCSVALYFALLWQCILYTLKYSRIYRLDWTTLHYTKLHYITLHYTTLSHTCELCHAHILHTSSSYSRLFSHSSHSSRQFSKGTLDNVEEEALDIVDGVVFDGGASKAVRREALAFMMDHTEGFEVRHVCMCVCECVCMCMCTYVCLCVESSSFLILVYCTTLG